MGFLRRLLDIFVGGSPSQLSLQEIMATLSEGMKVIEDIQYDTSQIDYTVFTRHQGIFIVRVIRDRGKITLDDKTLMIGSTPRPDIIKVSLRDTFFLKSAIRERVDIDAHVTPVVVFERAKILQTGSLLGVLVMGPGHLREMLAAAPERPTLPEGVLIYLRELQMIRTQFLRR